MRSTAPKLEDRCPPLASTASIIRFRTSDASSSSSGTDKFFTSDGVFIFSSKTDISAPYSAYILTILTIILFILIKNKKIGVSIFSNLAIITALNQLLKNILQRPRPTEYRILEETGYSFPSGHSMISMAFYGYLIYLIYKYVKNKYVKWTSMVLLSLLICSIGISRIYLGVHYTSDVLGGFLISISYLVMYISAVNKFLIEK